MQILSPLQKIHHPLFEHHSIQVSIKRDDLIHPIISGNKWRKLKYNLKEVKKRNLSGVVSFGGAYSNHIHALAYAAQQEELKCIGIIRGEQVYANNFTLSWARHWGMELKFVDRATYRTRYENDFLEKLQQQYSDYYLVPEGGSNALAIPGMAEVIDELNQQTEFDTLITPVGSGGTLAGLISGDNNQHQLIGVAVLKQAEYLRQEIARLLSNTTKHTNWQLLTQYHDSGYGKFSQQNAKTIKNFIKETGIPFEPIYSGKMLAAFIDLVTKGYFPANHKIVLLHTGGIQGLGGLAERKKIMASEWPLPPVPPVQ